MKNQVIKVRNLVKRFGRFVANDNLNFEVYEGEIFGFLGANGAGKTTAIRILSGLSEPTSGEVVVAGFDARRQSEKIKKNIGYMCQKFSLYEDLTVKENIALYGGIYGMNKSLIKDRTRELLEKLHFMEYEGRLISDLPWDCVRNLHSLSQYCTNRGLSFLMNLQAELILLQGDNFGR